MHLPPFKLEAIFEEYEHQSGMLVLGASDASSLTVQELFDLCGEDVNFLSIRLAYSDVRGELELREAVARSYASSGISPEQVLITVGGSEAIFIAVQMLIKAGDRVLVCDPTYQPLRSVAEALGAVVEAYPYFESNGFVPDLDWLRWRLGRAPKPRLLILNTPHNPTGHAISERSMRDLLGAAEAAGIQVLVDEVFSGIWIGATTPVPSAITLSPNAMVIGSLSKVYGLSGLRVGWLAGPAELINKCRQTRHYTTIAPPLLVQALGAIAVKNREKVLGRTLKTVEKNYDYARNWLKQHEQVFEWIEPQAGLVMLIRLKPQVDTDQFVRDLAKEKKVFLIPCSSTFDMPQGYLRLGLGTDPDVLVEGLRRLNDFIAAKGWSKPVQDGAI